MSKLQAFCRAGFLATLSGTASAAESAGVVGDNLIPLGIVAGLLVYAFGFAGRCGCKPRNPAPAEPPAATMDAATPEEPASEETAAAEPVAEAAPAAEEAPVGEVETTPTSAPV